MKWYKIEEKTYPKDYSIFLAKTSFCGDENIYLLKCGKNGKHDHISCVCGCLDAEDCIIGDIIEWAEIE